MTTWTWCAYSASGRTSQRYSLKGWIEQPSSECDVHGSNESDTRAKLIEPALHSVRRVENGDDAVRPSHDEIRREQSAVRIGIVDGNPIKRCRRRVDYLLHAFVGDDEQPLTPAFVELNDHRLKPVGW